MYIATYASVYLINCCIWFLLYARLGPGLERINILFYSVLFYSILSEVPREVWVNETTISVTEEAKS